MVLFHMTSIGTTDIQSLPSSNSDYNPSDIQNKMVDPNAHQAGDMNSVVCDIQNAAQSGLLGLPSRDIPTTQNHITMDIETEPNHIPTPIKNDYIHQEVLRDTHLQMNKKVDSQDTCDYIIDEFGFSILISIIYFLFQSEYTKGYIYKLIPFLHGKDSNPTAHGYMAISVMFGVSVYIVNYILNKFKS
jgi:hypothetical protein